MKKRRRRPGSAQEPQAVGKAVDRVLGDLGLETAQAAFAIGRQWADIAGEEAALHSRPVAVRGATLEVVVDSSVWCQELQLRRPALLEALKRVAGDDAPTDLRLRVGYTPRP